MPTEFEIGGNHYVAEKIWPARLQVHVVRRLGPAAATALAAAITAGVTGGDAKEAFTTGIAEKVGNAGNIAEIAGAAHKILVEISSMSDTAWDYIQDACLSVVKRQQGAGLAQVMEPRTKQMMFQDMNYQALLVCTFHVLRETYGDFFPGQQPTSNDPPAATAN